MDDDEMNSAVNGEDPGDATERRTESPSPSLEIEGIVEGEADTGQLEAQGGDLLNTDDEVKLIPIIFKDNCKNVLS